jgi:hypothetical protein
MRQFVSSLIFITGAFTAIESFAVTTSEHNYCEAILYGTDFGSQPSLFGDEFKAFATDHPEWRVAISWGKDNHFRMHLRMNEPITDRVLPNIPVPQQPLGTQFSVATVLPMSAGREEHSLGIFRVMPLREMDSHNVKYALTFKVDSMDKPLSKMDIITMYVAMAAVPYADHLILEQYLSLDAMDLNEAIPMRMLREAKNAGRADGEALKLVVPNIVRSLIAKGEPFKFIGRRHFASKRAEEKDLPSNLQEANRVYIQYHFGFPSLIQVKKSRNSSMN